jgi:hypothetical protein
MVAKKAIRKVAKEPIRLLSFLRRQTRRENKVIGVELAEDDGGMFYVFINTVDYRAGTYNKSLVEKFDDEDFAKHMYQAQVDAARIVGYKDVESGENLTGFSEMLRYTTNINNHTQPAAIEDEGLRKMII